MTKEQQGFYWAAIIPAAMQANGTHDALLMHEVLKEEFLQFPANVDRETGEVLDYKTRSTMSLTTRETIAYFDQIESWLNKRGVGMLLPTGQGVTC